MNENSVVRVLLGDPVDHDFVGVPLGDPVDHDLVVSNGLDDKQKQKCKRSPTCFKTTTAVLVRVSKMSK